MMAVADPQVLASDPRVSTFVAANAGSGKTSTLVKRVARLLLAGADPAAILCVTYTKAAAAEMQRRLFEDLGGWAVMSDPDLTRALARIDEQGGDLSAARALFARALETPGGLKIQTLHAFCEQLLRRFPLEAGISPGFTVLDDQATAAISARARDDVARFALGQPDGPIGRAYAHFSVQLDWRGFNDLLTAFEARRGAVAAYLASVGGAHGVERDVWDLCGFDAPTSPEAVEAAAMGRIRWTAWRRTAEALIATGMPSDESRGAAMKALTTDSPFSDFAALFLTAKGEPRVRLGTKSLGAPHLAWLAEEQQRAVRAHDRWRAAVVARDSVHAVALASAYAELYEGAKAARGELDFGDLIDLAHRLLSETADSAWVLYKLDGGIEHVLLDEGQDTAPRQWEILRALTAEFFTGAGAAPGPRTLFAVADEKQSIFSFQGAAPERFAVEKRAFETLALAAGQPFSPVSALMDNWRSTPEILGFVDRVFRTEEALSGLRTARDAGVAPFPIRHVPRRAPGGCVELWPLEFSDEAEEADPWAPVNIEPKESAGRKLARRIARSIASMVARGLAVGERGGDGARPCAFGDVLILVRRRNALFHEIIRALKREGVPVGGADRLKLVEHGVFDDLMALARFALFPADDLTLAALLRGPFCDLDEDSLFDLARDRRASLWGELSRRAAERAPWREAEAFLGWARDEARRTAPFDFYGRALSRLDGEGRSMRQRMLTRMGAEGEDALDAFLAQALAMEASEARDVETFVAQMSASGLEVKREQDDSRGRAGGEVRVMTVHGAKGLEAPIVFLPDTTARATDRGGPLLETADGRLLWAPRAGEDCPPSAAARDRRAQAAEGESARLLYVALTRARDRLIVCGVKSADHLYDRSWYDFVRRAFDDLPIRPFALEGGGEGWRHGADPATATTESPPVAPVPLPCWTREMAPPEAAAARPASPSALGEAEDGGAPSPLATVAGLGRYRRGDLIHHLLQRLPDLAPSERAVAADRLLRRQPDLTDAQRGEMAETTLAVLADPRFAAVFGPGSKPEVALAGTASGLPISGRVDRLVVRDDRVLVVDFKTNRPAPARIEDADPAHILQMAAYAAVLAEIFPGRRIEAALLWTDGPALMAVPENLLSSSLAEFARRA